MRTRPLTRQALAVKYRQGIVCDLRQPQSDELLNALAAREQVQASAFENGRSSARSNFPRECRSTPYGRPYKLTAPVSLGCERP